MVFWSTFLALIIGVMLTILYPRADRSEVEDIPMSEAYVAPYVAQHQFARDYANLISFVLPILPKSEASDAKTDEAKKIYVFKSEFDGQNLPDGEPYFMPSFMPFNASHELHHDADFTSVIFCLNSTKDSAKLVSCQNMGQVFKYVMTYGLLLPNDENVITHNLFQGKSPLWERALYNRTKGSPDCGYIQTETNNDTTKAYIMTLNGKGREMPPALYEAYYKQYISNNIDQQPVFCITPLKTPYILDGLLYHFDAVINATKNEKPIHSNTKKDGWFNIATTSTITNTEFSTTDVESGADQEWNTTEGESALELKGDTYMTLPNTLPLSSENLAEKLADSFTLSFVIDIDRDKSFSLFGVLNNTSYPQVKATINNSVVTIELITARDTTVAKISAGIPTNISEVTYVIGPKYHHIYINGFRTASQTFDDTISFSGLPSTTNLQLFSHLSSNPFQGYVYNVKLYDKGLTPLEIEHNFLTNKRRFNIN